MKHYRPLRGTLFDIERELRTRHTGADEAISEAMGEFIRQDTKDGMSNIKSPTPKDEQKIEDILKDKSIKDVFFDQKNDEYKKWKDACEKDARQRLQERLKTFGINEIPKEWGNDCSWEFYHWIAEGEMPNSYGFDLKILDYYFSLSKKDQKEFNETCAKNDVRTASAITWVLDRLPATEFNECLTKQKNARGNQESKVTIEKFFPRIELLNEVKKLVNEKIKSDDKEQEAYSKEEIEIKGEIEGIWNKNDEEISKWLKDKLDEIMQHTKIITAAKESMNLNKIILGDEGNKKEESMLQLIAKFRMIGHEMRKQLSNGLKQDTNKFKIFSSALKSRLDAMDEKFALGYGNQDGCPNMKDYLRMTFGEIGRAWGDTTAALGLHPWTLELLTVTHSAITSDYEIIKKGMSDGDFRELMGSDLDNNWCDMSAQGTLWSLNSNMDRYRDTIVILHIPEGQGKTGSLPRRSLTSTKFAATFSELRMSMFTPFTQIGTQNIQDIKDEHLDRGSVNRHLFPLQNDDKTNKRKSQ